MWEECRRKCVLSRMDSQGKMCWFATDTKTFNLFIEVVRGKLKGLIMERSRGFSTWIRFKELSLDRLLEGVEAYCREGALRWSTIWEDGGRRFTLEQRANGTERYIFFSMVVEEAKKYTNFPRREGLS